MCFESLSTKGVIYILLTRFADNTIHQNIWTNFNGQSVSLQFSSSRHVAQWGVHFMHPKCISNASNASNASKAPGISNALTTMSTTATTALAMLWHQAQEILHVCLSRGRKKFWNSSNCLFLQDLDNAHTLQQWVKKCKQTNKCSLLGLKAPIYSSRAKTRLYFLFYTLRKKVLRSTFFGTSGCNK